MRIFKCGSMFVLLVISFTATRYAGHAQAIEIEAAIGYTSFLTPLVEWREPDIGSYRQQLQAGFTYGGSISVPVYGNWSISVAGLATPTKLEVDRFDMDLRSYRQMIFLYGVDVQYTYNASPLALRVGAGPGGKWYRHNGPDDVFEADYVDAFRASAGFGMDVSRGRTWINITHSWSTFEAFARSPVRGSRTPQRDLALTISFQLALGG